VSHDTSDQRVKPGDANLFQSQPRLSFYNISLRLCCALTGEDVLASFLAILALPLVRADGWDDFSTNLATALPPFLALFGTDNETVP
jgi:hypothetical protein